LPVLAPPPAAVAGTVDHRAVVTLAGGRRVIVEGVVDRRGVPPRCTVRIDGQPLATIGYGDLEAYGCGGLRAAGRLRADAGRPRIGLIYDVFSPNARFRTALVVRSVRARWAIEPGSPGRFDDTEAARSISSLRRADQR
jgi:hypothetical protein